MAKKKRYLLVTAALLAVISLSIGSLCGARAWTASEKPQRQAEAGVRNCQNMGADKRGSSGGADSRKSGGPGEGEAGG